MRNCGWFAFLLALTFVLIASESVAEKEKGKGYLDDPNLFLTPGAQTSSDTQVTSGSISIQSKLSPTGSGVWYVRDAIEPVTVPPVEGEHYQAKVPATLDLAERGRLAVRAIVSIADPTQDYEIFGWIGNIKGGQVIMKHSYHDYNGGQPKWMEMLPLGRTMSGYTDEQDVDQKMMETMFRMLGPDGLYYIPARGASWVGQPDSVSPWMEPGVEQVCDFGPGGRALLTLGSWFAANPADQVMKRRIETFIDGMSRRVTRKDDYAYIRRRFYVPDLPVQGIEDEIAVGPMSVPWHSMYLSGIARAYKLTRYAPALELGERIKNYWIGPARVLKENGDWEKGLHFHGTAIMLIGLLDWALVTENTELLNKVTRAYECGRAGGNALLGWFPESYPAVHPNTEPCCIGDMTILAAMLSAAGAGDYWEDVEHYTRNLLSESQITDSWFVTQIAAQNTGDEPIQRPLESADRVAEKMIGTFSGMTSPSGQFQTVSSCCCTGNGNRGLYYAWSNIVSENAGELRVNLLLNRASKWADVHSYLPCRGQVDVIMKRDERLMVRIPSWVKEPTSIKCMVDNQKREPSMNGRFLEVGDVKAGQTISVQFPLTDETIETETAWTDEKGMQRQPLKLRVRGFNVVDIWPRRADVIYPFFTNPDYRQDNVLWKTTEWFAPEREEYW